MLLPGAVATVLDVVTGFSEPQSWADCAYFRWLQESDECMKYSIIQVMMQLLHFLFSPSAVKLCCLWANRQKVTPSYNISKIVQCPVRSCLFQAHWCKPPFLFSTLAFTGSERRGNGTELGKITVNHGNKPLRISSCSNGTTLLSRSRNFFFYLFLMNEPKSYTMSSHFFPPHMPKTFFLTSHYWQLWRIKLLETSYWMLKAKMPKQKPSLKTVCCGSTPTMQARKPSKQAVPSMKAL